MASAGIREAMDRVNAIGNEVALTVDEMVELKIKGEAVFPDGGPRAMLRLCDLLDVDWRELMAAAEREVLHLPPPVRALVSAHVICGFLSGIYYQRGRDGGG